jgi:enamine deaminase RidA (YjgF/YER057c/UK114 family)
MTRRLISTGYGFEREFAYSRAVVQGDWCFVAGVTGVDYATGDLPEDAGAQAETCLATIRSVLAEAGFDLADVVRVQYTVTDRAHIDAVKPAVQAAFAEIRPAATLVIAGLVDPKMKVEIEVTAYRGG